jgi:hypothetical protein
VNGSSLQIPLSLEYNKWTVVMLDVLTLLEENNMFSTARGGGAKNFYMRSVQMCASVLVKGIYTSDI